MTPQTDLFDLIKSLSASEKRYFKSYAAAIGGKDATSYMKLFHFIDKMNNYDEALLKKKFKHERFIKQLSVLKNYLFNIIIKSLLNSKEDVYASSYLQLQVASIQLLYEKGLHKLCYKTIKRLKETARQQEHFVMTDILCDWEIRLLMCDLHFEEALTKTDEQIAAIKERLAALEMKRKGIELSNITYAHNNDSQRQRLLKAATVLEKTDVGKLQGGILSRYYYHATLNIVYGHLNDKSKKIFYAAEAMRQIESNKLYLECNLRFYINLLYNYSNALFSNMEYEKLCAFLEDKKYIINTLHDEIHKELKYTGNVILLNIEVLLFVNGYKEKLTDDILTKSKKLIQQSKVFSDSFYILELCNNLIYELFAEKEYNEALYFVNEILNNKKYKYVSFIYLQTRLWELILHHELNNFILLKNLSEATGRYLQKEKQLLPFDSKLIQFLKTEEPAKQVILSKELLKLYKENEKKQTVFSLLQNNIVFEKWLDEKNNQIE